MLGRGMRARRWGSLVSVIASAALAAGLLSALPAPAAATAGVEAGCRASAGSFAGGDGSSGAPYLISTPGQLQYLRDTVSAWSAHIRLTTDIDMGGCTWGSTIGDESPGFTGVLDGAQHEISGLNLDLADNIGGLIATLGAKGEVRNLGFTGNVTATAYKAGYRTDTFLVAFAGGLVGLAYPSSVIANSYATGRVTAVSHIEVKQAPLPGRTAQMSSFAFAGGLVGSSQGAVSDSYATGAVAALPTTDGQPGPGHTADAAAGGLVGVLGTTTLSRSYSLGRVSGTPTAAGGATALNLGGLAGVGSASATVSSSFWDIGASGQPNATGAGPSDGMTGTTTELMKMRSTFATAGWSIADGPLTTETWGICTSANSGYPFLAGHYRCPSSDRHCPTAAGSFAGGDGSSATPYEVSTPEQLQRLRDTPSAWSSYVTITSDIDMGGCIWATPIGVDSTRFSGVLDGGHHTISGLDLDLTDMHGGLIGALTGTVRNLGFTGNVKDVTESHDPGNELYVGGLVGRGFAGSTIERSFATGTVTSTGHTVVLPTDPNLNPDPNPYYCPPEYEPCPPPPPDPGVYYETYAYAGGLVGVSDGTVSNSYATGAVSATSTTDGDSDGTQTAHAIAGGLAGFLEDGSVSRSYSTGAVVGSAAARDEQVSYMGGFAGQRTTTAVSESLWDAGASRLADAMGNGSGDGATGEATAQMKTRSTFADQSWSISDGNPAAEDEIWGICEGSNSGYPFLAGQYTCQQSPLTITSRSALPGEKLTLATAGGTAFDPPAGWTSLLPRDQGNNWASVASSNDGTHLAAVAYGGSVWISVDSGATWTAPADPPEGYGWSSVAMSGDGTVVAAAAGFGGGVWVSQDSGATWVQRVPSDTVSVAMSGNGQGLLAVGADGSLLSSMSAGENWGQLPSPNLPQHPWTAAAMSGDGASMALVGDGWVVVSRDGGASWTETLLGGLLASVAVSFSGTSVIVGDWGAGGWAWTSLDGGLTWTKQEGLGSRSWTGVSVSGDGLTMAAASPSAGVVQVSHDGGTTWQDQAPQAGTWSAAAWAGYGLQLLVADVQGAVWTSVPAVSYTVADGTATGCTVSATLPFTLTADAGGTCVVTATRVGNAHYPPVSSAATAVAFANAPAAPTELSASNGAPAILSFTPPGGTITGYEYSVDEGDWVASTAAADAASLSITGLSAGLHTVRVRAMAGTSASAPSDSVRVWNSLVDTYWVMRLDGELYQFDPVTQQVSGPWSDTMPYNGSYDIAVDAASGQAFVTAGGGQGRLSVLDLATGHFSPSAELSGLNQCGGMTLDLDRSLWAVCWTGSSYNIAHITDPTGSLRVDIGDDASNVTDLAVTPAGVLVAYYADGGAAMVDRETGALGAYTAPTVAPAWRYSYTSQGALWAYGDSYSLASGGGGFWLASSDITRPGVFRTWTANPPERGAAYAGTIAQALPSSAMTLTYRVPARNTALTVPLNGTVDVRIDWGDGSAIEHITAGNPSHSYTSRGVHTVSILGSATGFGSPSATGAAYLTSVGSWGDLGITSLANAFTGATSLTSVPATLPPGVTTLHSAFDGATAFNGDITGWDISTVTDMQGMFTGAVSFNRPIGGWDTSSVTQMQAVFSGATSFNQDLSNWKTSKVTTMRSMFLSASSFDQDLGGWNIGNVTDMTTMLGNSGLSTARYSSALTGWNGQAHLQGVVLGAAGLRYFPSATAARTALIGTGHWTIDDSGLSITASAPTITAVSPRSSALSVEFTAPDYAGTSPIKNYQYSRDGGSWITLSPVDATSPIRIPGLVNGTTYSVRIRAVNDSAPGDASNSVDGTPARTSTCEGDATGLFDGGSGTAEAPYEIATQAQLAAITDDFMACHFQQTAADIALTGAWTPIGNGLAFTGDYDGHRNAITGLNVLGTGQAGLFWGLSHASVENLSISGSVANAASGENGAGALAGKAVSSTVSAVRSTVTVTSSANRTGGLVGDGTYLTITGSSSSGGVMGIDRVGGLVGYLLVGSITDSYSRASVTGGDKVGGVVGEAYAGFPDSQVALTRTYAGGRVLGFSNSGGLMGAQSALPEATYGAITTPAGVVSAPHSLWDTQTTGQPSSAGDLGTGKVTADMKEIATFSGASWDIAANGTSATWLICAAQNSGYPILQGQGACKVTPTITTAPTASTITYLKALSASRLTDGAASVTGSFAWTDGTQVLQPGTSSQSVTFTPTDTALYASTTVSVSVTVDTATPSITSAPTAPDITYGQTLADSNLSGGAAGLPLAAGVHGGPSKVDGTFAWTTPSTAPAAGTRTYSVTFTPTDTTHYRSTTTDVSLKTNKATPSVTGAPTASGITQGQALSASALTDGSASVPGSFTWTSPATVPPAGTASYPVTFTPADSANYATASTSASVTVAPSQTTPTITTKPTASGITYGQTLASSTLSGGVASVPGTFAWTTPSTAPNAGTSAQSVTFTPTDSSTYASVTTTVNVTVAKATPTITTKPTASALTYGQKLSASALSGGAASVAGTFAWGNANTVPDVGTSSQQVKFTPASSNYSSVTTTVNVTVAKATPTITTAPTSTAVYSTQTLASSQLLNGVASVAGTFAWTTPSTIAPVGTSSQPVTFTPTDTAHYTTASTNVSVTVLAGQPTSIAYTGDEIVTPPTALAVSADVTGPGGCAAPVYSLDRNPITGVDGAYALTVVSGKVATTGWLEGVYLLTASYGGSGSCGLSTDTTTLTVAGAGNAANGGGRYEPAGVGRVNFGFTIKKTPTGTYTGSLKVQNAKKWRLTATLTTYVKTGTSGATNGTGKLEWWDATLNGGRGAWTLAAASVPFTASFSAPVGATKATFGVKITYTPTGAQPSVLPNSAPQTLKRGTVKVS